MTEAEKPAFVAVLNGLASIKPGAKLTPEAYEGWWLALSDWPLDEFRAAAIHLAKNCEFMPNPFHFEQLRKAGGMTAAEAFDKARQIVRSKWQSELLTYQSGDARLDAAIRACGGYEALAMCTTENVGFFERRFAEHFETITDAEVTRDALPAIAGGKRLSGPTHIAKIGESAWPVLR